MFSITYLRKLKIFFFIVETVCVPYGYIVRLKKQLSIKTISITEPDFSTPVDEIVVGVLEKKEVTSERDH
jgi:hypothetical protein